MDIVHPEMFMSWKNSFDNVLMLSQKCRQKIEALRVERELLVSQREELRRHLEAILNSTSWKIMKIPRYLVENMKKYFG